VTEGIAIDIPPQVRALIEADPRPISAMDDGTAPLRGNLHRSRV